MQNHQLKPLAVNHVVALPNPKRCGARRNFVDLGPFLELKVSVVLEQRLRFAEFSKKPQCSHHSTIFVDASPEENDGFAIEDCYLYSGDDLELPGAVLKLPVFISLSKGDSIV
ncbi:hypothetical protein BHE74_00059664 [Ensete ventricosum]|nr:hypothetical protein BHE74_00059664 [Ensete ventricosum]